MTLLDRLRAQPPQKHPDPVVRLAHVAEIPLDDRETIAAIARDDEDARVRKAAVGKLLDPAALGAIARHDGDESVRTAAAAMLRDIALEEFEGVDEADSLDAVDAVTDPKTVAHIAKMATRDIVALRALPRVGETRTLGSIARHAVSEAARFGALESLRERGERAEVLAVALNSEYKDSALAALDLLVERDELEQVAARGKNRSAAKRARGLLREAEERALSALSAAESARVEETSRASAVEIAEPSPADAAVEEVRRHAEAEARRQAEAEAAQRRAEAEEVERERLQAEAEEAARRESEQRHARLATLAEEAAVVSANPDLALAHRGLAAARHEWRKLGAGIAVDSALASRFAEAEARVAARDAEVAEAEARVRRDALAQLRHLLSRVEALAQKPDVSLKAVERALRDVRTALSNVPPLPSGQDTEEVTRRLRAMQPVLGPRAQELREADEWQRWANGTVQEQLCIRMEGLASLEDPAAIAAEVRELQQQWRQVVDAPRAQADKLWRRFKAAHDAVWPRCQALFAAEAEARVANLARKIALTERAEALAGSTQWIQTAEEIKRLQAEWKTIGPVSRGREKAIWDRFRAACDQFFTRRHADLAERKKVWAENFAKKEALCVRVEALADSTDWDRAAAEIRALQVEWKAAGPVKKTRSEAIWKRFRGACDRFFSRYPSRHETARAERVAAREAICAELEALVSTGTENGSEPVDLLGSIRTLRSRWQREIAGRGVDPDRARVLDSRFTGAFSRALAQWPAAFAGTDLDPHANRKRMESLVVRIEDLARSLAGPEAEAGGDAALSPTIRLAAMLKEALAANTIGGKVEEDSRWRAAAEEVRQAKAAWAGLGLVPEDVRRVLSDRFHQACRRITDGADRAGQAGGAGRAG
jgi:hypothetical protein